MPLFRNKRGSVLGNCSILVQTRGQVRERAKEWTRKKERKRKGGWQRERNRGRKEMEFERIKRERVERCRVEKEEEGQREGEREGRRRIKEDRLGR